jgi:ribosomal protein S27AE
MKNADLICKLCGSTKLTKYGKHPGGQRYLCGNCGHTFTDNKSLPGMKVNKTIIRGKYWAPKFNPIHFIYTSLTRVKRDVRLS